MPQPAELIRTDQPLDEAVARAFDRLRDATSAILAFDLSWEPTVDLVEIIAREIESCDDLESLTLVHPSASMTFIAAALSTRCRMVEVRARRSLWDEGDEDETTDATASKAIFSMGVRERHDAFVRRAVSEARMRVDRRFALVFDDSRPLPPDLGDVLFEELLHSGAREVGLIYRHDGIDVIADSLRLRLPQVEIAVATRLPRAKPVR